MPNVFACAASRDLLQRTAKQAGWLVAAALIAILPHSTGLCGDSATRPNMEETFPLNCTIEDMAEVVVRGSVEQIHVFCAEPNSKVSVPGPRGFRATGSTDALGGLVLRDVPPGDGYRVSVEASDRARSVRVLSLEEHPEARFYSSQELNGCNG